MARMFGTDGVRGKANVELTPELAYKLGRAAAIYFTKKDGEACTIYIGRDTRLSGPMYEAALSAGICSAGGNVVLTGIMPTPAVAYLARKHKADAGIECLVGSLRAITVRIQRQPPLTDQQHHSPNKPERIQYQQCLEELLPVHLFIGINPHCLKYQSLYRFHKVRPCLLSFINLCNILSQWIRNHHQQENL